MSEHPEQAVRDEIRRYVEAAEFSPGSITGVERLARRRRARQRIGVAVATVALSLAVIVPVALLSGLGRDDSARTTTSSAGGFIVFTTVDFGDGPGQIWRVNADGSQLQRLTDDDADYSSVAVSPDGSMIAFVRLARESPSTLYEGIYVANADGTEVREVLRTGKPAPLSVSEIRWSPGGSTLGFIKRDIPVGDGSFKESHIRSRLWLVGVDGSNPHLLMDKQIVSFSWSPDGRQIAYELQGLAGTRFIDDLFVMHADGTGDRRLTDDGASRQPLWSPDGSRIAFVRGWAKDTTAYVISVTGNAERHAVTDPDLSTTEVLAWSPDGSAMLVTSHRGGRCVPLIVRDGERGEPLFTDGSDRCMESAAWARGAPKELDGDSDTDVVTEVDGAALRAQIDDVGWEAFSASSEARMSAWADEIGAGSMSPTRLADGMDRLTRALRDVRGPGDDGDRWLIVRELTHRRTFLCELLPAAHPYRGGEYCD